MQKLSSKFKLTVSTLMLVLTFIDAFICMTFLGIHVSTSIIGSIITSILASVGSYLAL